MDMHYLKKLFFFTTILSISVLAQQPELVQNGNFDNGESNWYLGQYGGNSSGSVVNGEYRIVVSNAGSEHWHVQFQQGSLSLVQGKEYEFSFDAYKGPENNGSQSIHVNIGQDGGSYTSYFGGQNQDVVLTRTKIRYTFSIEMTHSSDPAARIEFNCGLSTGSFYIDNVSLKEKIIGSSQLDVTPLSIDFGTVVIGTAQQRLLTLRNNGGVPTIVDSISSSSGEFNVQATFPLTVAAVNSITVPVIFSPVESGLHTETITVFSNASNSSVLTVNCKGEAAVPGIEISEPTLHFSSSPDVPAAQQIILSNTSSDQISWSVTNNSTWATITPSSGTIVAGGENTCTITAQASSLGNYAGTLLIHHSAPNQPSPLSVDMFLEVNPGYAPTNRYILNPELSVELITSIAQFRMKARDNNDGGYFSYIDQQGNPNTSINEKSLCGQSRLGYAFTRAFMVTGEEQYLDEAHHALKFLYDHGWNNGWYFVTDKAGNYINHWGHNDWWSFQQHYALLGIAAIVEATGGQINWNDGSESDHAWLMKGIGSNYSHLWDSNESTKGYFDKANTSWTNKWGKGFTPTVDGITTSALLMALMYDSLNHEQRLIDLADNITDRMVSNMSIAAVAFPESYHSDWTVDYGVSGAEIGHIYKTSWVLARAYLLNPSLTKYKNAAQAIMKDLWDNGAYDTIYGGPYSSLYWQNGQIYNTNKNHWMVEQGVTSGLINYYLAETQQLRDMSLRTADGSMNFFTDHMIDNNYGESYTDVSRDGSYIVNGDKGGLFTAGYHSVELAYYVYLYSSLYVHKAPVDLYYKYPAENYERNITLTPVAIEDAQLKILSVLLDGIPYSDFESDSRTIHLPPDIGGKLRVTFGFSNSPSHIITASSGIGGSISPSGAVSVPDGNSQKFTITPSAGFYIEDVKVNGTSVGSVTSYTFKNVTSDNSISAVFSVPTHTISSIAGIGGTVAPQGVNVVDEGQSQNYTISPSTGYTINDVLIDGVSAGKITSYSFNNVASDHTISATFEPIPTHSITANTTAGGTITPGGVSTVSENGSLSLTITPEPGFQIEEVFVDGSSVGRVTFYTFSNVMSDHSISVVFEPIPMHTITARAASGGVITPEGIISVSENSSFTFEISSNNGFSISDVLVDGLSVGTVSSYTFNSVTASHSIEALFEDIPLQTLVNTDIGNPSIPGMYAQNGDQIIINGGGSDIWRAADHFHFAYQQLHGDMEIIVKVNSVERTDIWAKAGIMIRESLALGAKNAMVAVTPQLVTFQRRISTNNRTYSTKKSDITAPRWIRLVRLGNTFTAYQSPDGGGWSEIGSATVAIGDSVYAGLCVTAHNDSKTSKAVFESFTIIQE